MEALEVVAATMVAAVSAVLEAAAPAAAEPAEIFEDIHVDITWATRGAEISGSDTVQPETPAEKIETRRRRSRDE